MWFWCYSGESFVGHLIRVAHQRLYGKSVTKITEFVVDRYRVGFALKLFIVPR